MLLLKKKLLWHSSKTLELHIHTFVFPSFIIIIISFLYVVKKKYSATFGHNENNDDDDDESLHSTSTKLNQNSWAFEKKIPRSTAFYAKLYYTVLVVDDGGFGFWSQIFFSIVTIKTMRYFFSISARIHMKFNDNDVVLALSHRIFKFTSFVQYSCFSFLFHSTNWPFQVFFSSFVYEQNERKKIGLIFV